MADNARAIMQNEVDGMEQRKLVCYLGAKWYTTITDDDVDISRFPVVRLTNSDDPCEHSDSDTLDSISLDVREDIADNDFPVYAVTKNGRIVRFEIVIEEGKDHEHTTITV